MNKPPKTRPPQTQNTGVYKPDAIKDVAESLNITNLSDAVANTLASDVEYRIHQVIEEASRFMRHGRRTTMTTSDIDQALRVLNIEPLYGHSAHNPPTWRRALPFGSAASVGSVYYLEDEEIDFDRVLREEKIALPKGVSWTAHWLAVEGVQPAIPENPPAIPREQPDAKTTLGAKTNGVGPTKMPQQQQQLVKQVLSRELQLYYTRLTSALLPPSLDTARRNAAIASLRSDAGLQALIPYLIRWVSESVVGSLKTGAQNDAQAESDGKVLEVMIDVLSAILENTTLFVEPYLHQLLPPILSVLLHSTLPRSSSTYLRTASAQTLSRLLRQHSTTYPSLSPRIMKTLLLALISPGKSHGTREGAIRGLIGVGKEAVRKGLVEGGGAKVIASEMDYSTESFSMGDSAMDALRVLQPPNSDDAMDTGPDSASGVIEDTLKAELRDVLGDKFADQISDIRWARALLDSKGES